MQYFCSLYLITILTMSLVERHNGLTTNLFHTQLDPFASELTMYVDYLETWTKRNIDRYIANLIT